jgi:hypothetical protein
MFYYHSFSTLLYNMPLERSKQTTSCYNSIAISTLVRFHLPLALSRFHTASVKGMPFGACHGRVPQTVLTSASVVIQLVKSVDGEFIGGI